MNIILADGSYRVRHALRVLLEQQHDWVVVGEVEGISELITLKGNISPDLVIVESNLVGPHDRNSILLIRESFPGVRIIVMLDPQYSGKNPLLLQVDGYATKINSPANLLSVIRNVFNIRNYDD